MNLRIFVFCFMTTWLGCGESKEKAMMESIDEAAKWINQSVQAHGGAAYESANLAFDFRERSYTVKHDSGHFIYTSAFKKAGDEYFDRLTNEVFARKINGDIVELADSNSTKYANSLNSVIYFAMLPSKLQDLAVIKKYRGPISINEKEYHAIEVRFNEEGGGTDHDDTFFYWINTKTKYIDYLAYDYQVDGGGVRFRKAFNGRFKEGIYFQDYINYEAPIGTALSSLPVLYQASKLKELSKIELKNIRGL